MLNELPNTVHLTQAFLAEDLAQILTLQAKNMADQISEEELKREGFVSIEHDMAVLEELNKPFPHMIAKVEEELVGYALVMLAEKREAIPFLKPMFKQIEKLTFNGQVFQTKDFVVMGQICIAQAYRGQGLFDALYQQMQICLKDQFEYVITEVSDRNKRSLRAHQRLGFQPLDQYVDPFGEHWHLLLWNWR